MLNRNSLYRNYLPEDDGDIFSLSISDLMSALLLIFILLLSVTLLNVAMQKETSKRRLARLESEKQNIISQLRKQEEENRLLLDTVSEQEKAKRSIISELEGEMDQFDIEVVPETGAIRVKGEVLFDTGQYLLTSEGKDFLDRFIPKYAEILLEKEEIRNQIGQIAIEGHTDHRLGYLYNMDLSLNRANSVARYIFSERFRDFDNKEIFRKKLSVNGRSYMEPITTNETEEGWAQNRRVEFKFSFVDWTTVQSYQMEALR